jgi:hypothetical protein
MDDKPKIYKQARTVLGLLQNVGTRGIHSHELRIEHHIGNPSQRIAELEAAGYQLRHERQPSPYGSDAIGTRYFLESEPGPRVTVAAPQPVEAIASAAASLPR